MENSIEFFLNTHLEWSLSRQDLVITKLILELSYLLFRMNKENSIEFLLDLGYYLYLLYIVCATNPNLLII